MTPASNRGNMSELVERLIELTLDPNSLEWDVLERINEEAWGEHDACGCEKCHPEIHNPPVWGNSGI